MDEVLPLSENELALLGSLRRHKIRFLVVGLSAAALQGAPVVTEDIDLWFENLNDPKLSRALVDVGAAYVPPFGLNPPMLAGRGSGPFDVVIRMDGLDSFSAEWKRALTLKVGKLALKVLPLDRILVSKKAAKRPKDKRIIPTLENVLRTTRDRKTHAVRKSQRKSPKQK